MGNKLKCSFASIKMMEQQEIISEQVSCETSPKDKK